MKKFKEKIPLLLVLLLSCILNIWNIWNEGFGNLYYAAGVSSMGQNFHAFFYNSIDPIGFVSIDKPPLGLWIQVLFTKIAGYNGIALLLPQAIAGVISVYLIYNIMSKRFGLFAGITAAITLAVTPIFVAVSRNNTMDGILILFLILAADQAIKAAELSSVKHLIFSGIFIGLGFNVKMLQAFMFVPAIYITYLVFSNQKLLKRTLSCALSVLIMLVISFSWIAAVDITPVESRPYVGSSGTNSAFSLAFGYNGIKRIFGSGNNTIQPGQKPPDMNLPPSNNIINDRNPPPDGLRNPRTNPAKPGNEAGSPSFTRLINTDNAGQISWLLLPALAVCLAFVYIIIRKKMRQNDNYKAYFFWIACFLPMLIYFSFSTGLAHRYYFATFAPVIAALTGIGAYMLFNLKNKYRYIIPFSIAATGLMQLYIQSLYSGWLDFIFPVYAVLIVIFTIISLLTVVYNRNKIFSFSALPILLILPLIWSFSPVVYGGNAQLPISGPELINQNIPFKSEPDLTQLINYMQTNMGDCDYLVAVPSAQRTGSQLIIQSGEPVMVLGGFNGNDDILTVEQFSNYVKSGKIRFAIIEQIVPTNNIQRWIIQNGQRVDKSLIGVDLQLYEFS